MGSKLVKTAIRKNHPFPKVSLIPFIGLPRANERFKRAANEQGLIT